jgi:outer membrane protein insertion porin family
VKFPVKLKIAVIAALAAFSVAAAKISDIKFEQEGPSKITDEQLFYNIQSRAGDEYSPERIDADIKRLYSTGNFADVVSQTNKGADDTVSVLFKLRQKPQVRKIAIDGNAKFKKSDLDPLITLGAESPLNDAKLQESVQALRTFYKEKGFNEAVVSADLETISRYEINVTFRIRENLRLKVNDVTFVNATVYSERELRDSIANRYSFVSGLPWVGKYFNVGLLDSAELELDQARLRDLYWRKGYLDFNIEKTEITPTAADPEYVDLRFTIFEGKPYQLTKVDIAGNTIFPTAELLPLITLKLDEPFNGTTENASRKALGDYYESLGYADINVRPIRRSDFQNHTVEITFEITEGRKYSIRDVIISGNIYTKDKVIRRELAVQPGDPLDRNRIEVSKARLMGMGYFKKVDAVAVNADAIDQKDVDIRVEETDKRFDLKIGGGFSDVNSLVGMAEISSNNFDILNPGDYFYGGGQRFRIQAIYGIDRSAFNVDFTEPWLFDVPLRFDLSFFGNEVAYDDWKESRIGVRTALSHKLFDDFTSATAAYKFEQANVYNMSRHMSPLLESETGRQWVSQTSLMLDRDTRDSLTDPTSGYNVNLLSAVSPKIMGSSTNFYRLEGKSTYFNSFWDKAIVMMAGFRIGAVSAFDRDDRAPLFERYFLGGGDTIRGFPYRSVSPTDGKNNDAYGGQSMMLGTFEVTHPIWSFIRGAAFVDAGNAWDYSYNFQLSQINVGAGYGLRIKVPMINVPIKLDLAYPVVNNVDGVSSKLRFHFNMGFTF